MQSKDILLNDRFSDYLRETRPYKEMYSSKEGITAIVLAVISASALTLNAHLVSADTFTNSVYILLSLTLGGTFGLLGFLVGGLGILIGSISDEMIDIIDKGRKFKSLLSIVFRFYFDGAVLAVFIFLGIIDYLLLMFPYPIFLWLIFTLGSLTAYFFWYSLMLSVMLLGSSIRIIILRHNLK